MTSKASIERLKSCNSKLQYLLDITLDINDNSSVPELIRRFETILRSELNIGKVLVYRYNEKWDCILVSGVHRNISEGIKVEKDLLFYKEITNLSVALNPNLELFDVIIPVYHHDRPIAYVIIGDIDEEKGGISPTIKHLNYIQTLANIIVVAIENKRLFDENVRQEAIRKELELASRMQTMLIPNPSVLPNNDRIHVSAFYHPHFEVGGDYYDFIKLNSSEYGFCMADVSGKGISAALLMSNFQANVRALFSANLPLVTMVNKLNERVLENANGEKFITLFIGKYNIDTRKLEYINAGHNPSLLYDGNKKTVTQLSQGCTGIGMLDEIPVINPGTTVLPQGSKLICYTDGIVELENEKGEEFGTEQMEKSMAQNKEINTIIDEIINILDTHRGSNDFFDDITLMGIDFK